jgi:heme exporter protein B
MIRVIWLVLAKDLRAELRTREALVSMAVFALLTVVVFGFAFEPWLAAPVRSAGEQDPSFATVVAPGLLWVAFAFAGILGLNRSFNMERESGALRGLMLVPVDRGAVYLGKTLANTLLIVIVEALCLPLFALLFNLPVLHALARLWPVGLLGALGFAASGTIFAAVAANTRMRDIMLPFLLLPAATPVLVAAVEATSLALRGEVAGYAAALRLLVGFAVVYLTTAYLLFGYVMEE